MDFDGQQAKSEIIYFISGKMNSKKRAQQSRIGYDDAIYNLNMVVLVSICIHHLSVKSRASGLVGFAKDRDNI